MRAKYGQALKEWWVEKFYPPNPWDPENSPMTDDHPKVHSLELSKAI